MAATAVYCAISRVPTGDTTRSLDGQSFSNISATSAAFALKGGKYCVDVLATFVGGSVTLQRLGPDGITLLTAVTAFSANGTANVDLPPGSYKLALA